MANLNGISDSMKNCNKITNQKLNELKQFFGAYYHQDWTLDASDPDDVVHLFIRDENSTSKLLNLANNLEQYVAAKEDEATTEKELLSELGCYYVPSADGIGAQEWLYHVARLLRSAAE